MVFQISELHEKLAWFLLSQQISTSCTGKITCNTGRACNLCLPCVKASNRAFRTHVNAQRKWSRTGNQPLDPLARASYDPLPQTGTPALRRLAIRQQARVFYEQIPILSSLSYCWTINSSLWFTLNYVEIMINKRVKSFFHCFFFPVGNRIL